MLKKRKVNSIHRKIMYYIAAHLLVAFRKLQIASFKKLNKNDRRSGVLAAIIYFMMNWISV